MSNRIEDLQPDVADQCREFLRLCADRLIAVRVIHTLRTWDEQARIWQEGRTIPGEPCMHGQQLRPVGTCPDHPLGAKVTYAKPGYSWHNFGRAFDVALIINGKPAWPAARSAWLPLAEIAAQVGLEWGGNWTVPDMGHFQDRGDQTLAEARLAHDQAPLA